MRGSKIYQAKSQAVTPGFKRTIYFVTRRFIPGRLLSSRACFRFISDAKIEIVNMIQDYQINCKLVAGLSIKKCQLFSGRGKRNSPRKASTFARHTKPDTNPTLQKSLLPSPRDTLRDS